MTAPRELSRRDWIKVAIRSSAVTVAYLCNPWILDLSGRTPVLGLVPLLLFLGGVFWALVAVELHDFR
jgi:hypothetical protein